MEAFRSFIIKGLLPPILLFVSYSTYYKIWHISLFIFLHVELILFITSYHNRTINIYYKKYIILFCAKRTQVMMKTNEEMMYMKDNENDITRLEKNIDGVHESRIIFSKDEEVVERIEAF